VSLVFRTPLALVVNPSLPVIFVGELLALMKQKPARDSTSRMRTGLGDPSRRQLFQAMTGTKMNGIAYRGRSAPASTMSWRGTSP